MCIYIYIYIIYIYIYVCIYIYIYIYVFSQGAEQPTKVTISLRTPSRAPTAPICGAPGISIISTYEYY